MEFGLFWVPLAGGYLFLNHCNYFRFIGQPISGYRLLLNSACVGVFLLLFASGSLEFLKLVYPSVSPVFLADWVSCLFDLSDNYSRGLRSFFDELNYNKRFLYFVFGFAFLLGPILASLWNLFYSKRKGVKRALESTGNMMELMLFGALKSGSLIETTLTNGKVYVGWVTFGETQYHDRRFISLCPLLSGFRDNKHKVIFTTNYAKVYQSIHEDLRKIPFRKIPFRKLHFWKLPFFFWKSLFSFWKLPFGELLFFLRKLLSDRVPSEIILPVSELQSVQLFDIDIYQKFSGTTPT